jgi:hypothetical protein
MVARASACSAGFSRGSSHAAFRWQMRGEFWPVLQRSGTTQCVLCSFFLPPIFKRMQVAQASACEFASAPFFTVPRKTKS